MRIRNLRMAGLAAALLCVASGPLTAQKAAVTPVMTKELADMPGKEALMITVAYPPGSADAVHRHNAHVFVYVLEGSVEMQLKGRKLERLTAGQSFYEGPDDIHLVGRSLSRTKPAKLLVVMVKNKGAPVLVPVSE
jgi:quercetin dioxygenase-like cupin family protein